MQYGVLLVIQLLAFQEADLSVLVGRAYPTSSDSLYRSGAEVGAHVDCPFSENLSGCIRYSHTWVRSKTTGGWESRHSDEVSGTLRIRKRVFDFADLYLSGGAGVRVNPDDQAKLSICSGLGVRKTISRWISLDLGLRFGHLLDETPPLRNWLSVYASLGIPLARSSTTHIFTKRDELEIITRYLALGLPDSDAFKSNQEVEEFVNEFWIANDPTPHTPENELRDEILSRIEYANEWLRDFQEGWKTDRGRIRIIWGEPDEILRDQLQLYPVECWLYYRVYKETMPVVFVFEQRELYRQVFSNIPGEFGHNELPQSISPIIDSYIQKRW